MTGVLYFYFIQKSHNSDIHNKFYVLNIFNIKVLQRSCLYFKFKIDTTILSNKLLLFFLDTDYEYILCKKKKKNK